MTKDTIVTAIYHTSYESRMGGRNYSFDQYENPFNNLLNLNCNIVVFSHASEIPKIIDFFKRNNFDDNKVIEYDLNNYNFSDKIYSLKENAGIIDANGRIQDTPYIFNDRNTHLCLSKINFMKMAIEDNYFDSENYFWLDGGLFHHGIVPASFGGTEKGAKTDMTKFWPTNPNNICRPDLVNKMLKINNEKLLFVAMNSPENIPTWWNDILPSAPMKYYHIVGGVFGGDKAEVLKIQKEFQTLVEEIFNRNELTLEENILTAIVEKNGYNYLQFDTWWHDVPGDSCYYGSRPGQKSFYKVFIENID